MFDVKEPFLSDWWWMNGCDMNTVSLVDNVEVLMFGLLSEGVRKRVIMRLGIYFF